MTVFFRRIHLYLAFAAGLVFFVQCLTGTILVFEEEITHLLHAERYEVAVPAAATPLSLAQLTAAFQQTHPKDKVLGFKVYAEPTRTVELSFKDPKAKAAGRFGPDGPNAMRREGPDAIERGRGQKPGGRGPGERGKGRPERSSTAFLNPYTGQVVGTLDAQERTLFSVAEDAHRRLLAGEVGKMLTGISAIFILFITATGIVLWWPKTRQMLTGRLRIKWDGNWKRINHDLHIVLGFYCSLFLLGLALTGVIMSYRWATESLFWVTSSKPTVGIAAPVSAYVPGAKRIAYDAALQTGRRTYPQAEFWRVGQPKDSIAAVPVSAPSALPLRHNGLDTLFVDRNTGAVLGQHLYSRQSAGNQLRRLTKPLHTGEIGGIWTKILVFVIALISLTFPVTGVLLWLNRTRKKKPKSRLAPTQSVVG
ncbi:hypothetical protein GO988_05875 [Hymenobacter sp. HMF4947]|uniref:PepSY domain-containing protein n=1 Tax=Hymenobacter ginkgonis TaxID=2682976 RepID=A0A7K1TBT4_9BACT|nr:PepSY-associated TM helix domain-containing protein [Hymenobacter ginkgonis]MVN75849.1 hypothetical protein [Hymenobacter ginkgonis]